MVVWKLGESSSTSRDMYPYVNASTRDPYMAPPPTTTNQVTMAAGQIEGPRGNEVDFCCVKEEGGYPTNSYVNVGCGRGQYVQDTVYRYVGFGAGDFERVIQPPKAVCCCSWWTGIAWLWCGLGVFTMSLLFCYLWWHVHPALTTTTTTWTWTWTSTTTPCPTVWVPVTVCPPGQSCSTTPLQANPYLPESAKYGHAHVYGQASAYGPNGGQAHMRGSAHYGYVSAPAPSASAYYDQ